MMSEICKGYNCRAEACKLFEIVMTDPGSSHPEYPEPPIYEPNCKATLPPDVAICLPAPALPERFKVDLPYPTEDCPCFEPVDTNEVTRT